MEKKEKKKTVGLKDLENSISVFIISENIMEKREHNFLGTRIFFFFNYNKSFSTRKFGSIVEKQDMTVLKCGG